MNILGISAFYHDSAAALVRDGEIIAAAQEERFTRQKHDFRFPQNAIDYCLKEAGITASELDHVAFYHKPLLKFERLLETYLAYAPAGFRSFLQAMPLWLREKLHLPREMDKGLGGQFRGRYVFLEHHESHAASAFFPSPFEEAAILTVDGVGEWATSTIGSGAGNKIQLTHEQRFPHSLGLLYSAFTYYTGFRVNSGEYKLMGLAPYGEPRFANLIRSKIVDLKEDGSFRMDMQYFNYCQGLTMTNARFHALFGQPPRKPDGEHASLLGPDIRDEEARAFLDSIGAPYEFFPSDDAIYDEVADLIIGGKVVGWVQGRMEFGPRALGCRSILGDPRSAEMQKLMNLKIKFRESFRPFAPSVMRERVQDFFETRPNEESPYMLLVADVHPSQRRDNGAAMRDARGLAKLDVERSTIPAVTHVDNSARIQTVEPDRHGRFYNLMKRFEEKSGCAVLINTSFNIRGEPIVCTVQDAYRCFMATNIDVLVLGRLLLRKEKQPGAKQHEVDQYLSRFQPD